MQVIPSTGRSIANSLGWPDYETSDLYQPFVSVKFGSWYLTQQLDAFGIAHVALSAYNAGPGNAMRWRNRTLAACPAGSEPEECTFDYDLFVEIIHLRETRLYVRYIYKHFAAYQYLYGLP
jgi:soluble lytic murein transglycosylase